MFVFSPNVLVQETALGRGGHERRVLQRRHPRVVIDASVVMSDCEDLSCRIIANMRSKVGNNGLELYVGHSEST